MKTLCQWLCKVCVWVVVAFLVFAVYVGISDDLGKNPLKPRPWSVVRAGDEWGYVTALQIVQGGYESRREAIDAMLTYKGVRDRWDAEEKRIKSKQWRPLTVPELVAPEVEAQVDAITPIVVPFDYLELGASSISRVYSGVEEILKDLRAVGVVASYQAADGRWSCSLEIESATGGERVLKSGYDCDTQLEAVSRVCSMAWEDGLISEAEN